jgi:hypothetical protein
MHDFVPVQLSAKVPLHQIAMFAQLMARAVLLRGQRHIPVRIMRLSAPIVRMRRSPHRSGLTLKAAAAFQ